MSGVDPEITLHQDGPFCYRAQMEYTSDALDEMARRAAERIEDELVQQILARLGYVKPVRCRECKFASAGEAVMSGNWKIGGCHNPRFRGAIHAANVTADGYCAWGECREETE